MEKAFGDAAGQKVQAAIVFDDPVIWSHRKKIVAWASAARLPVMYGYSEFVSEGVSCPMGRTAPIYIVAQGDTWISTEGRQTR